MTTIMSTVGGRPRLFRGFAMSLLAVLTAACSPAPGTARDSTAPADAASPPGDASLKWDHLTMGDSFLARSHIAEEYTAFLEQDSGFEVELHPRASSGQDPEVLLDQLRNDNELRELVRAAEIITFNFSVGWGDTPERDFLLGICGGDDNQECFRAAIQQAKSHWTEMANIITELTDGNPVLVHTFTFGPWVHEAYYGDRATPEQKAQMYSYLAEFQEYQHSDAFARGMYAHPVFPPYVSNPPPDKYFQADGMHISPEGSRLIASMLRAVSYQRSPLILPEATPTPLALATPSVSLDLIAGTYTTTLTDEVLEQMGVAAPNRAFLAGTFKMELTRAGSVRLWKDNSIGFGDWSEGSYTLTENTLDFGMDAGREACAKNGFVGGSYRWSVTDGTLNLSLVQDECGRRYVMTATPWQRLP